MFLTASLFWEEFITKEEILTKYPVISRQKKNIQKYKKPNLNNKFSGKSIVFTGTLSTLSRDEAKYRAKTKGAKILSNVSVNTDYVVVGEKSGSKAKKAKNLGIKILNEKDFLKKISD